MRSASPARRTPLDRALLSGLGGGAIAAIAASLLSTKLTSPDSILINAASVSIAVLLAGIGAGGLWFVASRQAVPWASFGAWLAAILAAVIAGALIIERLPGQPLPHVTSYCIPLAVLVLSLLALLVPVLSRSTPGLRWFGPIAGMLAIVVGVIVARQAPANGGRLSLAAPANPKSSAGAPIAGNVVRLNDVAGVAFQVVPGESKATYTVHEKLASLPLPSEAVGSTDQVSGTIYLDGRPSTLTVDVKTLKSDRAGRDRRILNEKPGLAQYAPAEFTVSSLKDLPTQYDPGTTISRNVTGVMKLNGVEKPMTFAIEARLDDRTLTVHGATDFTWQDFRMEPPNFAGVVQVEDKVHIEVLVVARPAA